MAVHKTSIIVVGHTPLNFLWREVSKAFAEVVGVTVNRGAGYGFEVSCKLRLYGAKLQTENTTTATNSRPSGLYWALKVQT